MEPTPNIQLPRSNGSAEHIPSDVDRVAAAAHKPVKAVAAAVHEAVEHVTDAAPELSRAQKQMLDQACRYVAAHPVKALGMALAAGLLISRILR